MLLGIATVALRDFPAAEVTLRHAIRLSPGEGYSLSVSRRNLYGNQSPRPRGPGLGKICQPGASSRRNVARRQPRLLLLGQDLLRLGRVQEAKRALASSQRYREAKFRYDAKHTFDEQPSADGAIAAHPSARRAPGDWRA